LTGARSNSTTASRKSPFPFQRRTCASERSEIRITGWRFFGRAERAPVEQSLLQIDKAAADRRIERRAADRLRSRAGVEGNENEARDVLARRALRLDALLRLSIAPSRPDQARRLVARQPSLARRRPRRADAGVKPVRSARAW
jgi:hypothetical protein